MQILKSKVKKNDGLGIINDDGLGIIISGGMLGPEMLNINDT